MVLVIHTCFAVGQPDEAVRVVEPAVFRGKVNDRSAGRGGGAFVRQRDARELLVGKRPAHEQRLPTVTAHRHGDAVIRLLTGTRERRLPFIQLLLPVLGRKNGEQQLRRAELDRNQKIILCHGNSKHGQIPPSKNVGIPERRAPGKSIPFQYTSAVSPRQSDSWPDAHQDAHRYKGRKAARGSTARHAQKLFYDRAKAGKNRRGPGKPAAAKALRTAKTGVLREIRRNRERFVKGEQSVCKVLVKSVDALFTNWIYL